MRFSIDRFENDKAVLIDEAGHTIIVDKIDLPEASKEGDVLCFSDGEYSVLFDETNSKRQENIRRMKGLFKK